MNFDSPFEVINSVPSIQIDSDTKVVFVADLFVEQYTGGAELTTDALIKRCPYKFQRILSRDVSLDLLEQGMGAFWVFGNFSSIDLGLVPSIVANMNYSVVEYDYKFCRYRSPEKHKYAESKSCDCENEQHGKLISAFYYGAKSLFWMSEKQLDYYLKKFPFLNEKRNVVLSSVFDDDFFIKINELREKKLDKKGWIVLGSTSWVKGFDQAKKWCEDNQKEYEVVWDLPYFELLEKLAASEGFVYLPNGMDTCPRMVIEAKLLGCELHLNDFVQHKDEEWFAADKLIEIEEYLYGARDVFWHAISSFVDYVPTISGYVTARNCIEQAYPIEDCIKSMLNFCDEVVVVDGGSTDGTWEKLQNWSKTESKIKVHQLKKDWNSTRFAVFDGMQKAEARKLCTKEFCWQMDADEVVPAGDGEKVKSLCKNWPQLAELVSLPVVEYWGSSDKVRVDVNPWKWRISKNLPHITHGIPAELRAFDEDGQLYALPGTDGCDYINSETGARINHVTFYSEGPHNARIAALQGNEAALKGYEGWLQNCVNLLPSVKHYSWIDIARKIKTYKGYWQKHWESLYNIKQEDTVENNMFFDLEWKHITDEMIQQKAKELSNIGGWIFHAKWRGEQTPWISIK